MSVPRPHDSRSTGTGYVRDMSATPAPTITGIHHFSPTVSDVEASASWYEQVFSMVRLPMIFAHHEREDTGYAVLLVDPVSGLVIGLHHSEANAGDPFDEARTGLDHVGFQVPSRANLDAWVSKLDALGIAHSGIRDIPGPMPFSTLVFRDPDNIQLELIHSS
jgi:catechol 2,3-dioxygenase-like lactoylglutathione lyase family enzyme